jgi:hypothetical protein
MQSQNSQMPSNRNPLKSSLADRQRHGSCNSATFSSKQADQDDVINKSTMDIQIGPSQIERGDPI